jgi:hypothetical protein
MNVRHCESIYSWVIHQLVNSYDRLKSKFNSFAAKCLTERQKRECGSLTLIAPPLVLPCEEKAQIPQSRVEEEDEHLPPGIDYTARGNEERKIGGQVKQPSLNQKGPGPRPLVKQKQMAMKNSNFGRISQKD